MRKIKTYLDITLNVLDNTHNVYRYAKQGDKQSRYLRITLADDSSEFTFTSSDTVKVKCAIDNKTIAFNNCEIIDNNVIVELTENILAKRGNLQLEIVVYSSDGSKLTSATCLISIAKSIDESDIEQSQDFSALTEALTQVQSVEERLDNVIAGATVDTEVIDARDGESVLYDRLYKIETGERIHDNAIETLQLGYQAVTTEKICPQSVTEDKLSSEVAKKLNKDDTKIETYNIISFEDLNKELSVLATNFLSQFQSEFTYYCQRYATTYQNVSFKGISSNFPNLESVENGGNEIKQLLINEFLTPKKLNFDTLLYYFDLAIEIPINVDGSMPFSNWKISFIDRAVNWNIDYYENSSLSYGDKSKFRLISNSESYSTPVYSLTFNTSTVELQQTSITKVDGIQNISFILAIDENLTITDEKAKSRYFVLNKELAQIYKYFESRNWLEVEQLVMMHYANNKQISTTESILENQNKYNINYITKNLTLQKTDTFISIKHNGISSCQNAEKENQPIFSHASTYFNNYVDILDTKSNLYNPAVFEYITLQDLSSPLNSWAKGVNEIEFEIIFRVPKREINFNGERIDVTSFFRTQPFYYNFNILENFLKNKTVKATPITYLTDSTVFVLGINFVFESNGNIFIECESDEVYIPKSESCFVFKIKSENEYEITNKQIGKLSDLTTTENSNIVNAINELDANKIQICGYDNLTSDLQDRVQYPVFEEGGANFKLDPDTINEQGIYNNFFENETLIHTVFGIANFSQIYSSNNEYKYRFYDLDTQAWLEWHTLADQEMIGELENLTTTDKTSLVNAINEVNIKDFTGTQAQWDILTEEQKLEYDIVYIYE